MLILDANMILRFLLNDNEEMTDIVVSVLENNDTILLPEVLAEVVYVMNKTYKRSREYTVNIITAFMDIPAVKTEKKKIVTKGLQYFTDTSLEFVDCLLCAYHTEAGYEVGTFDNKLLRLIRKESEPKKDTKT